MNSKLYPWLDSVYLALQMRLAHNTLHHGLLFIADKGAGEHDLVSTLAKSIICTNKTACSRCKACMLYEAQSHPDVKQVVSDKPSIGVDLIRSVSEFVTSTSQLLGNKVVIIENIERMTESASNSLLKTLEEPNNNTYLLLSTTKPNALLATITSRCEKHRIALPNKQEALDWLQSNTDKPIDEDGLIAFGGSPLDYLASMSEDNLGYHVFSQDMLDLIQHKLSAQTFAKKWEKDASKALTWTYQYLIKQFENITIDQNVSVDHSNRQTTYQVLADECIIINQKISQAGINKSILLQRIFNQIVNI